MFRVEWLQSALDDLMKGWMQASSAQRSAITAASHAIDVELAVKPDTQGESRPKGRRITFFPPLGVIFRVDVNGGIVSVIHVWRIR